MSSNKLQTQCSPTIMQGHCNGPYNIVISTCITHLQVNFTIASGYMAILADLEH